MTDAEPKRRTSPHLRLWLALLSALLVGAAGCILQRISGGGLAAALLTGGQAFGGTVALYGTLLKVVRSR
jgi:hypothetical protein